MLTNPTMQDYAFSTDAKSSVRISLLFVARAQWRSIEASFLCLQDLWWAVWRLFGAPVLVPGKANSAQSITLLISLNGDGSQLKHEVTAMCNPIVPIRPVPTSTIIVPPGSIDREELIKNLPFLLEAALEYLLSEFDYESHLDSNTAIAARILAATIDRLNDQEGT